VPDCGLAPGLVSVLTKLLVDEFDKVEEIHLRVGGLPQKPKPPLNYALVFSVSGLINEYIEPVRVLKDSKIKTIKPLEDGEEIKFKGFGKLEAFNTSGGTSTLPETYKGKIKILDYKTIRYQGHCQQIKLLYDLGLTSSEPVDIKGTKISPRAVLEKVLTNVLPKGKEDLILLRAWGIGTKKGKKTKITLETVDRYDSKTGLTAMMRMTAFPAAVVLTLIGSGKIKEKGAMTQEHFVPAQIVIDELKKRGINIARSQMLNL